MGRSAPNLLVLMVDQLTGRLLDDDLIGHLHVPNLRRLMDSGVVFDNAYCSSPLCTPARGTFMSGQLPSRTGIYDNAAEFRSTVPTYAHYLRNRGYQTALSGKMHFIGADQLHGFEERLTTDIYPADFGWTPNWQKPLERIDWWYHNLSSVTGAGIAEISNQLEFDDETAYYAKLKLYQYARRIDRRPFCLTVSFTHPHDPYLTRQRYWDLYDHDALPMPAVPALSYGEHDRHSQRLLDAVDYRRFEVAGDHVRNARHAYFGNVSYLDEQIGEILRVLDECGFADDTVVVFCSDHGDMLGERGLWYKMSFFEHSMRIPLIINAPHELRPATVSAPVATQDILPTLLELAGGGPGDVVHPIDGESVLSLAQGADEEKRSVMGEYCAEGSVAPMVMIRQGRYKFTFCEADPVQLFDLGNDPRELNNLADDPGMTDVVAGFTARMNEQWDLDSFKSEVIESQACRRLVDAANRQGRFAPWDFQPGQDARERFMRNHMDLNEVEANNRYPG